MAILLLSQGIPMITAGDEVLHSQQGNNNPWCQDNELGWFDWGLVESNADMLRFTQLMVAFRKRHPCLTHARFLTGELRDGYWFPDITWHGEQLNTPSWDDPDGQVLAVTLGAVEPWEEDLHIMMNMSEQRRRFALPGIAGRDWHRTLDTSMASPDDVLMPARPPLLDASSYKVAARSVVVFEAR